MSENKPEAPTPKKGRGVTVTEGDEAKIAFRGLSPEAVSETLKYLDKKNPGARLVDVLGRLTVEGEKQEESKG